MRTDQDHLRDIAEIRSMMERSSKFLSLSGWAGIMAGVYALAAAYIAVYFLGFDPDAVNYRPVGVESSSSGVSGIILLAIVLLLLALGTAGYFSSSRANKKGEKIWNPTSRRLLVNMAVPLLAGGVLILLFLFKGLIGLIPPMTLLFYGLALYNAGNFTLAEVRIMGIIQILLGLISVAFIEHTMLIWAIGFGLVHIIYGMYMQFRYER